MKFNFISKKFEVESCSNYHLSVELSINFFRYAVLDPNSMKYLIIREYFIEIKNANQLSNKIVSIINSDEFVKRNFYSNTISISSINCIVNSSGQTSENEKIKMLELETDVHENIKCDLISHNDSVLEIIYSIPNSINNLFNNYFNNSSISCSDTILIKNYLSELNSLPSLKVHICYNTIYITYFYNNEVIFHNKFIIKSEEDILYLILNTTNQLKISFEECAFKISGRVNELTNSLLKDYLGEFTVEKSKIENTDSSKFKIVLNQII
ncbi:DUF3822 family protein [Bacteroidota bacterium]|nr:DUF3822 family protein [Bacteroidota bacterium]